MTLAILNYQVKSSYQQTLRKADMVLWSIAGVFQHLTNFCLLMMLILTSITILLRPFDISAYWIWPWTMVLFIWLCFFGFCSFFVRLKDVRIDLVAAKLGKFGILATRILSDTCTLVICAVLLWQMPAFLKQSQGVVDGALLPNGEELFRQALSLPLACSLVIILATAVLDLLKMISGLPENVAPDLTED